MASKFSLEKVLVGGKVVRKNLSGYDNWVEFQLKPEALAGFSYAYHLRNPADIVGKTTRVDNAELPRIVVSNLGESSLFRLVATSANGAVSVSEEIDLGQIPLEVAPVATQVVEKEKKNVTATADEKAKV